MRQRLVDHVRHWLPAIVASLLVAAMICYLAISIARSGHASRDSARTSQEVAVLAHRIDDCIQPGGSCYERSQANQRRVLAEIAHGQASVGVYIYLCTHDHPGTHNRQALIGCVITMMKEHGL